MKTCSAPVRKTLGPVHNLEEHVNPDWWKRIFNSIYLKTDADVVDDSNITRSEVDLILGILGAGQDSRMLDLCCGQGRHTIELASRGYKNTDGLDRSHYLIQKAKAHCKKENLPVRFREGDARKMPYPHDTFEVVMILGNSYGYFETVEDDIRVLKEVFKVLKPWGKIIIDVTDGEYIRNNFLSRSWEWIDKQHFVCRERTLSHDRQRLISREVVTHISKGVIVDQFYAERLYTRESLSELLKKAGFADVTVHDTILTDSQRNQDLGMMERRIIVTALCRKEWAPDRRKGGTTIKDVAVLLGDPSRPDPLKPLGIFDDDDFYTIDQLKDALRQLKDYRFTYLTHHESLFMDLLKLRSKTSFIFNLCDEGFLNDPTKELHVPALLDMIRIPYTGAGPQCISHCYDKSLVRGIAKEMGIRVPEAFFIKPEDSTFELPFEFPVIVKPNFGDGSFGITQRSVVCTFEALLNAIIEIRERFGYDKPILVEEFLVGKDLTCGIIGNPPGAYTVLPLIEEDYSMLPDDLPKICAYEAKWSPESPYWNLRSIPAVLPEATEKAIIECSLLLFERLECRDYARFDWRLDGEGSHKLLEVNPNPGWCWDGHLVKMGKLTGMSYAETLEAILHATEQRLGISADEKREDAIEKVLLATC
ncbi:MAG: methyltransferase domain-containing protein [Candidatus Eremiobacteraeota bacterium]|nr:methyltransferase domain-containing protein [Candidatus Eremiobacteraeota bacterium]